METGLSLTLSEISTTGFIASKSKYCPCSSLTPYLTLCMLGVCYADFFFLQNLTFSKNSKIFSGTLSVSNSLEPDEAEVL